VKFNYWKVALRSLLASMEATLYTTELADSVSVRVNVVWLAEALSVCRQRQFSGVFINLNVLLSI
jgi:hypothetical protein